MVIWSGGVFIFHAKPTPKSKPHRQEIEFNSLKKPNIQAEPVETNEKPEIIEDDFLAIDSTQKVEFGDKAESIPISTPNTDKETFETLLGNQDEQSIENIDDEFTVLQDIATNDDYEWEFEGLTEPLEGEIGGKMFIEANHDVQLNDVIYSETNHAELLEELLVTHELVCEMQREFGCDYFTALEKLPESSQNIYQLVGFQPENLED
jgi:hypothetical protein